MNSDFENILDLPFHNNFFQKMLDKSPEVLINIELLFENKILLDSNYHEPKHFILQCNNILNNFINIIEYSKKSKNNYKWLYDAVCNGYLMNNKENYIILKTLRNLSAHHKMIIPDGSLSFNLYKIMSKTEYKVKICLGDDSIMKNVPDRIILTNTQELFNKLLSFYFITFMDIEHSSIGECLGITRRWFYNVKYTFNSEIKNKIVDIYELISESSDLLFNCICNSFSHYIGIEYKKLEILLKSKYNFVNTLLEIDIYPTLFNNWWKGNYEPMNFKHHLEYKIKTGIEEKLNVYKKVYDDLPKNLDDYLKKLEKYEKIQLSDFANQEEYNKYLYFVSMNHWYMSKIDKMKLIKNSFNFKPLMDLLEFSHIYIVNIDTKFDTFSKEKINSFIKEIGLKLMALRNEIERILK